MAWESRKQASRDRLRAFRGQLDERRAAGREKLAAFSEQAGTGFEQIQQAFKTLVS